MTAKNDGMSVEDQLVVAKFAAGNKSLFDAAVAIHRRYNLTIGPRTGPHQQFMAECDNVSPDLVLRSRYRKIVLDLHGMELHDSEPRTASAFTR